ncbi:MAG: aldehyde dehydrogenase family protein, partial [Candidatus Ranarchaeia archaeon]
PNKNVKNQMEYRPLEGFVFAISPFNFTSIGANLCTAPAIMGNVVLWKPSTKVVFSNYLFYKILEEAGLPKGIINFIPGRGKVIGPIILNHKDLAGVHFTGSTRTLNEIWEITSKNFMNYKNIPRIVGETGGKGFFIVHKSANIEQAVTGLIRGAFGYQGQKCSAASRGYISKEIWPHFKMKLIKEVETVKLGSPEDPTNFMGAVIDQGAFDKISSYIKYSLETEKTNRIIFGGKCDSSKGYFIEPTIIETKDPDDKLMKEEIFGPVVTVYVYDDFSNMLEKVDNTSPYGLTGCIFAEDKEIIEETKHKLRYSAGNFYINDKPTGAVVGQQPFGGARASGTNDKAGSFLNLVRWTSPRAIKENFKPSIFYKYDYMAE